MLFTLNGSAGGGSISGNSKSSDGNNSIVVIPIVIIIASYAIFPLTLVGRLWLHRRCLHLSKASSS